MTEPEAGVEGVEEEKEEEDEEEEEDKDEEAVVEWVVSTATNSQSIMKESMVVLHEDKTLLIP